MRLLHFADLHLDTQFAWLAGKPSLAASRRLSLRDTLERIVDLAVSERVDALVCGGDLYEHERFTPDTVEFVRSSFARAYPLSVFIAPGNHDWLGPSSLYQQADWSLNVHVFREDYLLPFPLEEGLTLWGAAHRAPANTDGFLDAFKVDRAGVHVALFHGSEQGALGFQERGKAPHAPFRLEQIPAAGLHHALLGHFHRPRATEHSTYPGNPEPLSFGEDGQRGAVLVTVNADGSVHQEWRSVAAGALHTVEVDVTGCASQRDVRELIACSVRGLDGCIQVTLRGDLVPTIALQAGQLMPDTASDTAVIVRTGAVRHAYDLETIRAESTVRGQFARDVLSSPDLDDETRQRVLITGLRALDGRDDLDAAD
ncbi:MAG: exonuclease SbcCD subunit D [Chloroflexota bacterium]